MGFRRDFEPVSGDTEAHPRPIRVILGQLILERCGLPWQDGQLTFRFTYRATVAAIDGDARAIGAAVTVALCGHWDHAGACRWPHLTTLEPAGLLFTVTVAYTCADRERSHVESLMADAIASGTLTGPDGTLANWEVVSE